jgi:hypothetical protein
MRQKNDKTSEDEKRQVNKTKQRAPQKEEPPESKKSKGSRSSERRGKDRAIKKLEEIRNIARTIDSDTVPDRLWKAVDWMIEHKREDMVYELLEDEDLSDEALTVITFLLEEIGYRHPVTMQVASSSGKMEKKQGCMIPFALVFAITVHERDITRIPSMLPKTINRITEEKIIRRACGLGQNPSILLDSNLYHLDHGGWTRESEVRSYLKSWLNFLTSQSKSINPLSSESRKPFPVDSFLSDKMQDLEGQFCFELRAMCAVAIIEDDETLETEDTIFADEDEEGISRVDIKERQLAWSELEEIISHEIDERDILNGFSVFIYPQAIELWDVPHIGKLLKQRLPLQMALEKSLDELLAAAPEGEAISPILFLSHHGKTDMEEIRIAAYTGSGVPPFFRYVWQVDLEIDDVEEIADVIIDVSNELQAKIIIVDGLHPNDRCPDCGEPTFFGPDETLYHEHEKDYIN